MKKETYLRLIKEHAESANKHCDSGNLKSFWRGFINGIMTVCLEDIDITAIDYEDIANARDEAEKLITNGGERI